MKPEQALENLRQLCARPTTQINGLAEAQVIGESIALLSAVLQSIQPKE